MRSGSVTDDLIPLLKKLRLSGVLQTLELRTKQATDDDLSHSEYLYRVLADEGERRDAKQLDQRIRRACFEHGRTIEDFDFHFNPQIPKAKVLELGTCAFVERHENILLVGKSGVGKSHLAQALGHRACRAGYSVLYTGAHELFTQLRAARGDGSYDHRLLRFTTQDLLIVDDVGLRPLAGDEPLDLYELIRGRYERGSTVITSNRAKGEWLPLSRALLTFRTATSPIVEADAGRASKHGAASRARSRGARLVPLTLVLQSIKDGGRACNKSTPTARRNHRYSGRRLRRRPRRARRSHSPDVGCRNVGGPSTSFPQAGSCIVPPSRRALRGHEFG